MNIVFKQIFYHDFNLLPSMVIYKFLNQNFFIFLFFQNFFTYYLNFWISYFEFMINRIYINPNYKFCFSFKSIYCKKGSLYN